MKREPPSVNEVEAVARAMHDEMAQMEVEDFPGTAKPLYEDCTPQQLALLRRLAIAAMSARSPAVVCDPANVTHPFPGYRLARSPGWEDEVEFEIWQGDELVAGCSGPREQSAREAGWYATVYGQDGSVEVRQITRTVVAADLLQKMAGVEG